jgi:nucleolar protein 15
MGLMKEFGVPVPRGAVASTPEEAERIAAESLNGYPLGGKVVRSEVVDPHKVHPDTFRNADRKWSSIPWRTVVRQLQSLPKSSMAVERTLKRKFTREDQAAQKLKAAGIDFEGPSFHSLAIQQGILLGDGEDEDEEDDEDEEEGE